MDIGAVNNKVCYIASYIYSTYYARLNWKSFTV